MLGDAGHAFCMKSVGKASANPGPRAAMKLEKTRCEKLGHSAIYALAAASTPTVFAGRRLGMRDRHGRRRLRYHLVLLGLVLLLAGCSKAADTPPPLAQAPAPPSPDDYIGADTCQACHEDSYNHFAATKMGKLFLK